MKGAAPTFDPSSSAYSLARIPPSSLVTCACVCVCISGLQLEARLAANPYDLEAQTELERIIADKNITENYETAMEHMPESFAR